MNYTYRTKGVCSRKIQIELDDKGRIEGVFIEGGCHGNGQGISALVKGQQAGDIIKRLTGIRCEGKPTSCPDQLAKALAQALQELETI